MSALQDRAVGRYFHLSLHLNKKKHLKVGERIIPRANVSPREHADWKLILTSGYRKSDNLHEVLILIICVPSSGGKRTSVDVSGQQVIKNIRLPCYQFFSYPRGHDGAAQLNMRTDRQLFDLLCLCLLF